MNEQLKIIISAEVDKLKKGVQDAKKEVSNFKQQVQEASKNVDSNFKQAGEGIKNATKKIAVGIAGAGTALLALGASTKDYRAEQAKLNSAFETAGASADTAKQVYNDLYRVLGESDTSVEAANHLAQLTTNQKDLSEWTTICQGVYATFGDSLPIEGLTEAANETAKTGSVTGSLADALNWAGISEDEFNAKLEACNSEAEREQLIRETLIDTYDEAAAAYEKNAEEVLKQNEAQAKLQENLAKLGEVVAPVVTLFTQFATDALAVVVPYIQQLAEQYGPVLQTALEGIAEAVGKVMGFIAEHWEFLIGMAAVIGAIATAIGIYNAVAAVKLAMDAAQVTTLGALIAAYAAQAAAMIVAIAPYLLIVAAIAAVIAIIVLCVKHWDKIKEATAKAWEFMKEKTKAAADAVVKFFTGMKDKISNKAEEIKTAISNKFDSMKTAATEKIKAMKDSVVNKFGEIKSGMTEKVQSAKTAVVEGFSNMKSSAIEKVTGIVSGVKTKFGEIKSGITEKIDGARDAVKNAIDKMKSFFNFKWELPKIKLPSIKITGKFSLDPPQVPKFSISWNALGGVFDKPTLFGYGNSLQGLGEDGAEAVVPLEKNTQWLDRIAEKLAAKQGKTPIILQVDGKTFAKTSIDSINQLTKQTGTLGLVLV